VGRNPPRGALFLAASMPRRGDLTTGTSRGARSGWAQQSMSAAGARASTGLPKASLEACKAPRVSHRSPQTGTPARGGAAAVVALVSSKSSPATPKAATSPLTPVPGEK